MIIYQSKRNGFFFLVGILAVLLLLAASLSNLQLQSGAPLPGGGNSDHAVQFSAGAPSVHTYALPLLRGFFALILVVFMLYVPARLIALVKIKTILFLLLVVLILFVLAYLTPGIKNRHPAVFPNESSTITYGFKFISRKHP